MTGRNSHQLGREIHEVCWSNPWDCIHMNTLYDDWKKQPPLGKKPPLSFLLESSSKHVWTTIRGDYTGNGDSSHWVRVDVSRCVAASVVTTFHHNQIELDADAIVESLPCDYWHNQIESDSDAIVGSLSFPGGLSVESQLSLTSPTKGWTSLLPTQYEIERLEPPSLWVSIEIPYTHKWTHKWSVILLQIRMLLRWNKGYILNIMVFHFTYSLYNSNS